MHEVLNPEVDQMGPESLRVAGCLPDGAHRYVSSWQKGWGAVLFAGEADQVEGSTGKFSFVGEDGDDLTAMLESYIEKAEGMREFIDHTIRVAARAGWRCGQKKYLMPGIWAVRWN